MKPKTKTVPSATNATLTVETRKISELKPHPKNPRKHPEPGSKAWATLEASMKHDYFDPLVWNRRNGMLVSGHLRAKVLGTLGYLSADVVVVDYSEPKHIARMIAANKAVGSDDLPKMQELFAELKEDKTFDLAATGFSLAEINVFSFGSSSEAVLQHENAMPGKKGDGTSGGKIKAVSKEGDLWLLGSHRLLCGSSLNPDDVAKLCEKKAKLAFTSPPYADQRKYAKGTNISVEDLAEFITCAAPHADFLAVNLGMSFKDGEVITYWDSYIEAARKIGLKLLAWNIWNKLSPKTLGQQNQMFPLSHEWIFVFGAGKKFNNKILANSHAGELKKGSNRSSEGHQEARQNRRVVKIAERRPMNSILDLSPASGNSIDHPAVFPVGLPESYILAMTDEGDTVLESFGGSGTTLIACEKTGRACNIMELTPTYCDLIVRRWQEYSGKKAKHALTGKSFD